MVENVPRLLVSHLEADFGDRVPASEQLAGTVEAQPRQEIVWRLPESRAEEAMKMEFGKAGLAGSVAQQHMRGIFGGEEIASPAETAEGVVV